MRKIQPRIGSWSPEPGNSIGQIMTVLSRDIYWLFLHKARQGPNTPGRSLRLLAPAHMWSTPKNWRAWRMRGSGCGDRRVSRDPKARVSRRARSLFSRQAPHQESWHARAQLSSEKCLWAEKSKRINKKTPLNSTHLFCLTSDYFVYLKLIFSWLP